MYHNKYSNKNEYDPRNGCRGNLKISHDKGETDEGANHTEEERKGPWVTILFFEKVSGDETIPCIKKS